MRGDELVLRVLELFLKRSIRFAAGCRFDFGGGFIDGLLRRRFGFGGRRHGFLLFRQHLVHGHDGLLGFAQQDIERLVLRFNARDFALLKCLLQCLRRDDPVQFRHLLRRCHTAAQFDHRLRRRHIPHAHRSIVTTRDNLFAIGRHRAAQHGDFTGCSYLLDQFGTRRSR